MATLADLLVQGTMEGAQKTGENFMGGVKTGAALAESIENMRNQRAQIEQQKQQVQVQKFDKVGSWFEAASKMEEGASKKAFVNDFIPKGIQALGLQDQIDPTALKMFQGDPVGLTFLVSEIRDGRLDANSLLTAAKDPETAAKLLGDAKNGMLQKQFADSGALQETIQSNLGEIDKAAKFKSEQTERNLRAEKIAGAKSGQQGISNLSDLRKERTGHPITKSTLALAESYDKIRASFGGNPDAVKDMSGIFAYMKMLDPASTVREGEQAQARQATGVPEQILNLYNRVVDGTPLTAQQRKKFIAQATKLYSDQYARQQQFDEGYKKIAQETGLNPNLIFAGTKFKAPPPNTGKFKLTPQQIERYQKASPDEKKMIIKRLEEQFGISAEEARKTLGE